MTRFGMLINTKECIGCYTCRVSCQRQNNLNAKEDFVRFIEKENGVYPHVRTEVIPLQCQHCADAPCAKACPTGATYVTDDGVVRVDREKCIGCKYCMAVCPYDARVVNEETGTVDKCRLCAAELERDGVPNCTCVSACLVGCRMVGDLDDPSSEISKAILEQNAQPLTGDANAKIFYVR